MVKQQDKLTAVFSALADPTRRRILERLASKTESRVTALAKPFRMSLPAISKHLRVLEEAQLVKRQRQGREHIIRANRSGLKVAQKWIARHAAFWADAFDALDQILAKEAEEDSGS